MYSCLGFFLFLFCLVVGFFFFFPNTGNKTHADLTTRVQELGGIPGLNLKPLYFKSFPGSKAISINFKYSLSILFLGHQFSSTITAKITVTNYFPNFTCLSF